MSRLAYHHGDICEQLPTRRVLLVRAISDHGLEFFFGKRSCLFWSRAGVKNETEKRPIEEFEPSFSKFEKDGVGTVYHSTMLARLQFETSAPSQPREALRVSGRAVAPAQYWT